MKVDLAPGGRVGDVHRAPPTVPRRDRCPARCRPCVDGTTGTAAVAGWTPPADRGRGLDDHPPAAGAEVGGGEGDGGPAARPERPRVPAEHAPGHAAGEVAVLGHRLQRDRVRARLHAHRGRRDGELRAEFWMGPSSLQARVARAMGARYTTSRMRIRPLVRGEARRHRLSASDVNVCARVRRCPHACRARERRCEHRHHARRRPAAIRGPRRRARVRPARAPRRARASRAAAGRRQPAREETRRARAAPSPRPAPARGWRRRASPPADGPRASASAAARQKASSQREGTTQTSAAATHSAASGRGPGEMHPPHRFAAAPAAPRAARAPVRRRRRPDRRRRAARPPPRGDRRSPSPA